MTFLELVNRLRLECGVAGPQLSSFGNTGLESLRMQSWISDAWRDVQTMKDEWAFMRKPFIFTTTAKKQTYNFFDLELTDFANWKLDSFRCVKSNLGAQPFGSTDNYATFEENEFDLSDEQLLGYLPFDQFRNVYQFGTARTNYARPVVYTITPEKYLAFGPIPDVGYQIVADYFKKPFILRAEKDKPEFPERFHMLLVYMAMKSYGAYESAPEVYQRGQEMSGKMLGELMINELPTLMMGAPLA